MDMKKPFSYLLYCLILTIVSVKSDQLLSMHDSRPFHKVGMHGYNFAVDIVTGRYGAPSKASFDNALAFIQGVHKAEAQAYSKALPILAILSGGLAIALAGWYLWDAYDKKRSVKAIELAENH